MKQARGAYVSWQLPKFASRNRIDAEDVGQGRVRQKKIRLAGTVYDVQGS